MNQTKSNKPCIVIGIDVGGPKKGFHGVAFREGSYLEKFYTPKAKLMAKWCLEKGARAVGIDAPCRWSQNGRARAAERALMQERIWCFSTPTRAIAKSHSKRNFHWMLAGAELYSLLVKSRYRLFDGHNTVSGPVCFETFPQAVACALAGKIVSAKRKGIVRRKLLSVAGIDTTPLTNIDTVDAALCALTAHCVVAGEYKTYGDTREGLIVVPAPENSGFHPLLNRP